MFNSVNVSIRLLAEYAADRGLLALRWGLDVARGYQRAADGKERVGDLLWMSARCPDADAAQMMSDRVDAQIEVLRGSRVGRGPLHTGARLAISGAELLKLQVAAEDLRSEALRREQNTGAQA